MTNEWQPIETVPRDGTRVLVYLPRAIDGASFVQTAVYNRHSVPRATHWMPLPEPPR
jgi:hypothetical protein